MVWHMHVRATERTIRNPPEGRALNRSMMSACQAILRQQMVVLRASSVNGCLDNVSCLHSVHSVLSPSCVCLVLRLGCLETVNTHCKCEWNPRLLLQSLHTNCSLVACAEKAEGVLYMVNMQNAYWRLGLTYCMHAVRGAAGVWR